MINVTKRVAQALLVAALGFAAQSSITAQTVEYSYDACGNRIARQIILGGNKSLFTTDDENPFLEDAIDEFAMRIYPNPTYGMLKVEIQGITDDDKISIEVFDLNGSMIRIIEHASQMNTIDLSDCTNGIYLMRIRRGETVNTWKILKR